MQNFETRIWITFPICIFATETIAFSILHHVQAFKSVRKRGNLEHEQRRQQQQKNIF